MELVRVGVDSRVSKERAEELAVVNGWFAGHDGDVSLVKRVFMLGTAWKSAKSSGA